jgi:hypothetical protein
MKSYNVEHLNKKINDAINEQNHFWWGCVIGIKYGSLRVMRVDKIEEPSYCVDTEEERNKTFMPIVRVKYGSPYKDREKTGHIVKWYSQDHEPVNVSYLRIKPEPVIYETGAKKHYINSLILFTDNTKSLILLRDEIYMNHINETELKSEIFVDLCNEARLQYLREVSCEENREYKHIKAMQYKKYYNDVLEFCQIYANDFNNWKFDHR